MSARAVRIAPLESRQRRRISRPTSDGAKTPAPAVNVTPVPFAADGVSVVAIVLSSCSEASAKTANSLSSGVVGQNS